MQSSQLQNPSDGALEQFPSTLPDGNEEDGESEDEEEGTATNNNDDIHRKSNIYLASLRLSQKSPSERSSLYSPKSCPICLEEYKVGDEIAWSKNEECPHAFHFDCILEWLLKHDECPLCRGDFLNAMEKENLAYPETEEETAGGNGGGDGE